MRFFADLHIHSRYSRATSSSIDIHNLEKYARLKGLNLLGTGDFTHPLWLCELKKNLSEDGSGILKTQSGFSFVLQTELSFIFSHAGKLRKIHLIVLAPSFDAVSQINDFLASKGRLDYDGRPVFGMPAIEFLEAVKEIDSSIEVIPAHCWTPHFGIFGSVSGFDSVEECFGEKSKYIHALETGLSSDPAMNWRLSALDRYSLVSFSDAHSCWPWRLGRELTLFDIKPTYKSLIKALKTKQGLLGTIEFFPEEGKYHFDGHRNCGICLAPKEAIAMNNICPVCHKQLTIGVLHRVEELADRPEGSRPASAKPFKKLVPLSELIAAYLGNAVYTKKVWGTFNKLVANFGNELNVLLEAPEERIKAVCGEHIASLIIKNRNQRLAISPGYDGVYGKLQLEEKKQTTLDRFK